MPFISEINTLKQFCKNLDTNIEFKYTSTIKSFLFKNKPSVNNTAGVYKIPCKDCDLVYVDEMERNIDFKIKEHKYSIRTGNTNNAVFKHMYDNHNIHRQNGHIIHTHNDYTKTESYRVNVCTET